MNLKFTKKEFRTLLDLSMIDLRANNIVYCKDKKYDIETLDNRNEVVLKEVRE